MVIYYIRKVRKLNVLNYFLILTAAAGVAAANEDFGLFAYPNPFVAGYAGAQLAYRLPADAVISICVYDLDGNHVRTLVDGANRAGGDYRGRDRWDGRDDDGEIVDAGPYLIVLDVRMEGKPHRDTFVAVVDR